jgi:anti-anti-sigma factor
VTEFTVTARHEDDALVVTPRGELDIATVGAVRDAAARRSPEQGLVIDLSGLEFLDTSGIAFVVEAYRSSVGEGFPLRIVRAAPLVQRVFEIAGLEGVLPFEDGADA